MAFVVGGQGLKGLQSAKQMVFFSIRMQKWRFWQPFCHFAVVAGVLWPPVLGMWTIRIAC